MGFDVSQYLLKTGPMFLSDLVTRVPEFAAELPQLKQLMAIGDVQIDSNRAVFDTILAELAEAAKTGMEPEDIRQHARRKLDEIPGAEKIRVRLSESAFRKAFKST